MDMFTLKQSESDWIACCRACGHEQTLAAVVGEMPTALAIKCERCPSEDPQVQLESARHLVTPGLVVG